MIRRVLQSFGCLSGQPAIFIAIESSITDMETFQCFCGHNLLTNEFYTNGFQKPLQLAEIIVELPFMWKLSSYIASMLIIKEN